MKIAFVVATKDRPKDLRNMLKSLGAQSRRPNQVIIVDGSVSPVRDVTTEFPELTIEYVRHYPPSMTAQRNAGLDVVGSGIDLVGFMDDDITFDAGAMEAMLRFWDECPSDVGGCSFNLMNWGKRADLGAWLRRTNLARWLGLYSRREGVVMPSGWGTVAAAVPKVTYVAWLQGTAMVWRRDVVNKFRFDEWFTGYSYLEDLDFSYSVGKKYRLAIVADAGFRHYPSYRGRKGLYSFGKQEVRNRLYFVRKHGLSVPRCYLGIIARLGVTIVSAVGGRPSAQLARAAGNVVGVASDLLASQEPSGGRHRVKAHRIHAK